MCPAVEKYTLKTKSLAVIDYMRDEGKTADEIVAGIVKKYPVSKEYVENLIVD